MREISVLIDAEGKITSASVDCKKAICNFIVHDEQVVELQIGTKITDHIKRANELSRRNIREKNNA